MKAAKEEIESQDFFLKKDYKANSDLFGLMNEQSESWLVCICHFGVWLVLKNNTNEHKLEWIEK